MPHDDQIMTVKEVAKYLKVHTSTVYRLAQAGTLPRFKIGGDWRFNKESVDRWRIEQERAETVQLTKDAWLLIDLHGNRKLLYNKASGEQRILREETS